MASNKKEDDESPTSSGSSEKEKNKRAELINILFNGDELPGYLDVKIIKDEVTLLLDLGVDQPEAIRRLEEVNAMNYEKLTIARLEIDGPKHLHWGPFTNTILRLLVGKQIPAVGVPELQVDGTRARITQMVLFCLRFEHKADHIKVRGEKMPLRSVVDTDIITSRIIPLAYSPADEEVKKIQKILTSYLNDKHIPKPLRSILGKAHTMAKNNYKKERRARRKRQESQCLPSTSTSSTNVAVDDDNVSVSSVDSYLSDASDDPSDLDMSEDPPEIPDSFLKSLGAKGKKNPMKGKGDAKPGSSKYKQERASKFFSDKCYVCTRRWRPPRHPTDAIKHYPSLCPACAEVNWAKRTHSVDLTGYVAVVTGGRIKIGFDTVLKLLRCGSRVVTTTRFPRDAAQRFSAEPDYKDWCDRLQIYPLELKDARAIYKFIEYLKHNVPHVDILISNAAQTIRRPISFFEHLLEHESKPFAELSEPEQHLLAIPQSLTYQNMGDESMVATTTATGLPAAITGVEPTEKKRPHPDPLQEASNSKRPRLDPPGPENTAEGSSKAVVQKSSDGYFPQGCLDEFGQQVDLRPTNSWRSVLEEVCITELLEVMMINTIAPYILCKELKELMVASPNKRRFIVNISAVEGRFNRATKTRHHPHTNMAKAALNMMTRTGALGYRESSIYMTSVDTGWVSDQRPFEQASYERDKKNFVLPLDCIDAAARILDPVFCGIEKAREPFYAVYLKNYKPFKW